MNPEALVRVLAQARRSLAVAESFTGGRVLDAITEVPGASAVVRGGIVAYSDEVKRLLLEVPQRILLEHGSVSAEVAAAMARGVKQRFEADVGLATTGIAGPTGATTAKPLGLSLVAVAYRRTHRVDRRVHLGSRGDVKGAATRQALEVLATVLRDEGIL